MTAHVGVNGACCASFHTTEKRNERLQVRQIPAEEGANIWQVDADSAGFGDFQP